MSISINAIANGSVSIIPSSLSIEDEDKLIQDIQIRFQKISRGEVAKEDIDAFIDHTETILRAKPCKRITDTCEVFLIQAFLLQRKHKEAAQCARAALARDLPNDIHISYKSHTTIAITYLAEKDYGKALEITKSLSKYLPKKQPYLNRIYTIMTLALTYLSKYEDAIESAFAMAITSNNKKTLKIAFMQNLSIFEKLVEKKSDEKAFLPFLALYCTVRNRTESASITNHKKDFSKSSIPRTLQRALKTRVNNFQIAVNKALKEKKPDGRNPAFDVLLSLSDSLVEHKHFEDLAKMLIPLAYLPENEEETQKLYEISTHAFEYLFDNQEYSNAIRPLRAMLILAWKKKEYMSDAFTHVFKLIPQLIRNKQYVNAKSLIYSAHSVRPSDRPMKAFFNYYFDKIDALIQAAKNIEISHTLLFLPSADTHKMDEATTNGSSPNLHHQKPDIDREPSPKRRHSNDS
ncbi:MAG: hypothetical protein KR126chlam1_00237 [Chlamydiae bacterium]|nr:hypothetical protein [Chlamydiota bacterium]